MLSVVQSCVLGLESDLGRALLTVFTLPIVARMSGFPLEKLIIVHNIACSLVMLFICIYVLNRVPDMVHGMRIAFRQVKAIFVVRGLAGGFVTIWRRLRIAELMTCAWLTMFTIRLYIEIWEKGCTWREAGPALLASIAESTNTPISLLSLALTVSFVCKWIVDGTQLVIGGRRDHGHVLAHSGYTEALTLVLLCLQTGLLGMKTEKKAFLLGLVLFIVMSALLQSLYELLEPQLLSLAALPSASRGRHIRCLLLAANLFVAPIIMAYAVSNHLSLGLIFVFKGIDVCNWCVIIVSNCVLTTIHAASSTVQYAIGMIDSRSSKPWGHADDLMFWTRMVTKIFELSIALIVLVYGIVFTLPGKFSKMRSMCWKPVLHLQLLESERELNLNLVEEIGRDLSPERERIGTRDTQWRELRGMEGAHDMWPLMEQMTSFPVPPLMRLVQAVAVQRFSCRNSAEMCPSRPSRASRKLSGLKKRMEELRHIPDFPLIYPDFLQSPVWNRRNKLKEELEHQDMLERRMNIDIPEFYVGSVLAVTTSEKYFGSKEHRFVGICIRREKEGLHHQFTLRNVIEGIGVEVMYDLYNPTIRKIETLKLEKRLDKDLSYLADALPEYSTFDFHMEPTAHPAGTPVPINPIKVKLQPPPWSRRWELYDYKGMDGAWAEATPFFKRKFHKTKMNDYLRFDLVADYRVSSDLEHELNVEEKMQKFEKERHEAGLTRRRIFRSAAALNRPSP
uniref:Large ribosomal subunit protein bL19m n=1 Tax=Angiostrongylus cantonensis TaxID=6313 RepID=A0A0K0CTN6_ANGCA